MSAVSNQLEINSLNSSLRRIGMRDYLRYIFQDLLTRSENNLESEICREVFSGYLNFPLFVGNKIFDALDISKNKYLDLSEFIEGMIKLFQGSVEETIEISFNIFSFNKNDFISQQDVLQLLIFLQLEGESNEDLEDIVKNFFGNKNSMTFIEYRWKNITLNSDILYLLFHYLNLYSPFSQISLNFFFKNNKTKKYEEHDLSSYIPYTKIIRLADPSRYAKMYTIFSKNPKNSSTIRRKGTKNLLKYLRNLYCTKNGISEKSLNPDKMNSDYKNVLFKYSKKVNNVFYKLNRHSDQTKLVQYKLVCIENDLYCFEFNPTKNSYKIKEIHSLNDYLFTTSDEVNINGHLYHTFAFLMKYGNNMANVSNVYLSESKRDIDYFLEFINRKVFKIKKFGEEFQLIRQIAKGQFGEVNLAKEKRSDVLVAVKTFEKNKLKNINVDLIKSEIDILRILKSCNNPFIIKLIDVYEDKFNIHIIMEYIEGGTLSNYIKNKQNLWKENEIKSISHQILSGLICLNKYGVVHRDLKPENILVTFKNSSSPIIKIADFGLSTIIGKTEKTLEKYGSLLFTAPEVLLECKYDSKIDIWSFGVILYYMSTGRYPFNSQGNSYEELVNNICDEKTQVNLNLLKLKFSADFIDLLKMCLTKIVDERPSVNKIIELKYWDDI